MLPTDLMRQQAPWYLWIGCPDSRASANEIVGLLDTWPWLVADDGLIHDLGFSAAGDSVIAREYAHAVETRASRGDSA